MRAVQLAEVVAGLADLQSLAFESGPHLEVGDREGILGVTLKVCRRPGRDAPTALWDWFRRDPWMTRRVYSDGAGAVLRTWLEEERRDLVIFLHSWSVPLHVVQSRSVVIDEINLEWMERITRSRRARSMRERLRHSFAASILRRAARLRYRAAWEVWTVSEEDAKEVRSLSPEARVRVVPIAASSPCPLPDGPPDTVGFTGSFGHIPNMEAVRFLLSDVWPRVRRQRAEARLVLAGSGPPADLVEEVGRSPGVLLRADLADLRSALAEISVVVAPLFTGTGIRTKILDALGAGRPVIATNLAVMGLAMSEDTHYVRAESGAEFAQAMIRIWNDAGLRARLSDAGHRLVREKHGPGRLLQAVTDSLDRLGRESVQV